jgi:hypothetical protein
MINPFKKRILKILLNWVEKQNVWRLIKLGSLDANADVFCMDINRLLTDATPSLGAKLLISVWT